MGTHQLVRHSKNFLKRNSSTILTWIGAAGVVVTTVSAVKATPKALLLLEEAKEEKGEDLTKLEAIKVAGPVYIPSVLLGVSTVACIFGSNALNKRYQASLISAYALLNETHKDYKKKVEELYGTDAKEKIQEELAKDKYEDDISVEPEKQLFFDEFSGRYFESTTADVVKAQYELNKHLSEWGSAYLNDFYELLDIPVTDFGDHLGWSANGMFELYWSQWLDFHHQKVVLDDGLECTIISFFQEPIPGFEDY